MKRSCVIRRGELAKRADPFDFVLCRLKMAKIDINRGAAITIDKVCGVMIYEQEARE